MQWTIPEYRYTESTTLSELIRAFLSANRNEKAHLAQDIGTSVDQIDRWLENEFTTGLTTKNKGSFERVTRIELERLYVIEAKRSILGKVSRVKALKRSSPSFVRLLERDPQLGEKINFDRFVTREEIVVGIQRLGRICGYPLLGLQIGADSDQMPKWKEGHMPSGELLERCIIGVTIDLYVSDPDDTRFRVTADALLGNEYAKWLGASSLREFINVLFPEKLRHDPPVHIANRIGLTHTIVKNLLDYQASGKIPYGSIIRIIRSVLARQYKDRLGEYDRLVLEFQKNIEIGEITFEPMRLDNDIEKSESDEETPAPPLAPTPVPVPRQASEPAHGTDVPSQVRAHIASLFSTRALVEGQLASLKMLFPDLLAGVSVIQPATPAEASIPAQDPLTTLVESGAQRFSKADVDLTLTFLQKLVALAEVICKLTPDQRTIILHQIDPYLVRLKQAFDAAGTQEPEDFLRLVRSGRPGVLG